MKKNTVYNLMRFMREAKQHPQYPIAVSMMESGMQFTHEGISCRVFNPELAMLFMQKSITGNRLTIITHEDLTDTREQQKDIEIEVLPLLEAYCGGYHVGEREIMQAHPNPPATAGYLVEYFNKHLRRVPFTFPGVTTIEGIAEIGRKAGQFGAMDSMEVIYPGLLKAIGKQPENKPKGESLTHAQIALIHAYEGREITKSNCEEIAAKHGWNSPTSGESIRQEFCKWQHPTNRHGNPDAVTSTALRNKIKLIEGIIPLLSKTHMQRAIDEVKILKSHLLNSYNEEL